MLNTVEREFVGELAVRVRNLRLRHALSQQELADTADLSRNVIISLEQGHHLVRPFTIRKLAEAFGVPLVELTGGE
jgi:transcriptional regulator with XRE-family HTH domain